MHHQTTTIKHHEASVARDIEHRTPAGWWILPAAVLGLLVWYVLIRAVASLF